MRHFRQLLQLARWVRVRPGKKAQLILIDRTITLWWDSGLRFSCSPNVIEGRSIEWVIFDEYAEAPKP